MNIQKAVREAKDLNGLSIADLAQITGDKPKTVESWLYETRKKPTWKTVFLIERALWKANMKIPRELYRYTCADINRSERWAKNNCKPRSNLESIGERVISPTMRYVYHGELLKIREIAEKRGASTAFVRRKIEAAKVASGANVTKIVDVPLSKRGRKPGSTSKRGKA